MQELEKIFEEIDAHAIEFEAFGASDDYISAGWVKDIIRKHLSRENTPEITRSPRDNDGWIPVEERLPGDNENVLVTTDMGLIASGYIVREKWITDDDPDRPIAWRPFPEPFRPERSRENEK